MLSTVKTLILTIIDLTFKNGLTADSLALVPNCCMDTSEPVPNCPDILDPSRWCQVVLGPKCLGSEVSVSSAKTFYQIVNVYQK